MSGPIRFRSRSRSVALRTLVVLVALLATPFAVFATETPKAKSVKSTTWSYTSDDRRDGPGEVDAYTLTRDHGHWRNTTGSQEDWDEVQALMDRQDSDFFWFRRGEERYIVTDPKTLQSLAELFAPQEELGRRQGELGRKQGELGRFQGQLGRMQAKLGLMQARLGQQQAAFMTQSASRRTAADDEEFDRMQDELTRRQNEIGELQSQLGDQQSQLGDRQSELGEQQSALGREQERVSREIQQKLGAMTRDLIQRGVAKRLTQ